MIEVMIEDLVKAARIFALAAMNMGRLPRKE
jgi:hypothetical protein